MTLADTLLQLAEAEARIKALRSKQDRVGPYRAAGIQRSIDAFKEKAAALRAQAANGDGR